MPKKIIANALFIATLLGSFAVLSVPTFAATDAWHQVTVSPGSELVLAGNDTSNTTLAPTISAIDSKAAGAIQIQSSVAWKLQYQAVTGTNTAAATTAAPGTSLGNAGFAATGGYSYSGNNTAAMAGTNSWGVTFAAGGTGATLATTALSTTLSNVATGTSTNIATITPTYSAGTDGSLGTTSYYGTIYYNLSAQ